MVDLPKRREAEFKKLLKGVQALIKGKMYCEITYGCSYPATVPQPYDFTVVADYWIDITGPYDLATEMRDLVNKCPNFAYISHHQYQGSYDWASDTYIKDSSAVQFLIR